ncbi:hypothetical protein GCM10007989_29410 [Devosia pacifica]|uniref:Uncharacterized protein n=1 Tax=Devosia pacifica TaxID=1335967 RepID=A0A918SCC0_9HYPH|nr:hypothetical protein GCM10007989_29410 [Devosia pacifica]
MLAATEGAPWRAGTGQGLGLPRVPADRSGGTMSTALDLIRVILREEELDDAGARHALEAALLLEIDPLEYCIHRRGLAPEIVWERAAEWVGMSFLARVPPSLRAGSTTSIWRIWVAVPRFASMWPTERFTSAPPTSRHC